MNRNLGITRTEKDLNEGIESVDYFLSVSDKLKYDCEVSPYQGYSIKQMLLLAKAILMSAKERRETRGAHIREDYPERSEEFACPSYAKFVNGAIEIAFEKENDHAC